ncbi:hypothetical protein A1O3_08890 [Capronia epimyces CBS 606.96]|uniref:ER transporter 6TM N-terminal domain-containing protein n=1 Tax=Capronia epimyces CBS 606.96 TaxID=1182542 RepID=W9XGQ1_9EURO|nr:uncharacterized protein A1O3_08890 [Capronia epimyces CBS 606.96]EXJ79388.1 hypothetical protein A1O3_08890 [Capronia epimyces CBS 606.96]
MSSRQDAVAVADADANGNADTNANVNEKNVNADARANEKTASEPNSNSFFESAKRSNTNTNKKAKAKLPPILDHFNAKDLKELFKSSVAVWILTLFIVINPTLRAEGQALFFGSIVLFIAPPSGIVLLQVMIGATILLGMALGWCWGLITMKAALAARSQAETNVRLGQLQQEATRNATNVAQLTGQTSYAQILIYDGFMLDARVTAVYFCMICLFIYLFARLRVAAPKLVLVQMFGIIVADIFLTTGPILPSFVPLIPTTLIKPAATAVAVGTVCNILFFPKSTSHIVLSNVKELIVPMAEFIDACRIGIGNSQGPMDLDRLRKAKASGIASYKALESQLAFLPLDVSFGRWNAEDIALLTKPLKHVFIAFAALVESQITRVEAGVRMTRLREHAEAYEKGDTPGNQPRFGHHQLAQQLDFARLFQNAESEELVMKSLAALQETSDPLLSTCTAAIEGVAEALTMVNEKKFYGRPSPEAYQTARRKHSEILQSLRQESKTFVAQTPPRLLDPHSHYFDEHGFFDPPPNSGMSPMRGVVLGLILEERILSLARALEHLVAQVVKLEEERTQARVWLPTGLRHLASWVFGRESTPQVTPVNPELEREREESDPALRRQPTRQISKNSVQPAKSVAEPEATPTAADQLETIHLRRGKTRSRTGRFLLGVTKWFSNTEGMFALRVLIVTIALGIPAVLPSSAGFYFREKGLWGLIMAQITLVPYAADFTWGLILRMVGTVIGGILGMLAWYIGAGNGPGSPYGIAAVMIPFIIVYMWLRLFGPPAFFQASVIATATTYLTVAYSWVDTHIPSYGNPGVGYTVFWRRMLLVMIGFGAAAIVMYFPRPPSAGRHYRKVLSRTLSGFQDLYALFVTEFTQDAAKRGSNPDLLSSLEKASIGTADTLGAIAGPIQLLRFEFSSSDFTAAGLSRITTLAGNANFHLSQLFTYSSGLPDVFKKRFRLLSGAFGEHFVGDLMSVLSLLSHSLQTGEALPNVLPSPLMVRAFRDRIVKVQAHTHGPADTSLSQRNDRVGVGAGRIQEEHVGKLLGPVTRQLIERKEEGFRKYCVAMSALVGLLTALDEMVLVVKEELGESHLVDIESWGAFEADSEDQVEGEVEVDGEGKIDGVKA